MISLHIKGDLADAFKAAKERNIELTSIACSYRSGIAECFASCYDHQVEAVMRWYSEDAELIMGYGYEKGTLVFFSRGKGDDDR